MSDKEYIVNASGKVERVRFGDAATRWWAAANAIDNLKKCVDEISQENIELKCERDLLAAENLALKQRIEKMVDGGDALHERLWKAVEVIKHNEEEKERLLKSCDATFNAYLKWNGLLSDYEQWSEWYHQKSDGIPPKPKEEQS